jgi:hypothetical protein
MKMRQISDEQEVKEFESYMTKKNREKKNTNTKNKETLSNNEDNGKTKHRSLNDGSTQKQNCRSRNDPRMRR